MHGVERDCPNSHNGQQFVQHVQQKGSGMVVHKGAACKQGPRMRAWGMGPRQHKVDDTMLKPWMKACSMKLALHAT